MKGIIKKIMTYRAQRKINWSKTLFVNLCLFPFADAIKLPVICYGSVKIVLGGGGKIILSKVSRGVLKIGFDLVAYRSCGVTTLKLFKNSQLCVNGEAVIMQGATVLVGTQATLTLNNHATIGDRAEIICRRSIIIGEYSEVTWDCQCTDFGSHPTKDKTTGCYSNIYKPVRIGNYCWIGNRTTIQPGTTLPDRVIVASNSLLNKDYVKACVKSFSLIGGIPARVLKENIERNYEKDHRIQSYFFAHPEIKIATEETFSS